MPEKVVVAFVNTKDYPISVSIRFNKRPIKITLWRDQRIADREGNPILPDKEEWPWLLRLGLKPIYADVETLREEKILRDEVILDDAALMEAHERTLHRPKVAEFETPPEDLLTPEEPPTNHLDRKENPNPHKADLVWQDADGLWILNKDGFSNLNPVKIKHHIKKTYGEDYLETVEWRQYGAKPPEPSAVKTS
jgi:hypothetical protein